MIAAIDAASLVPGRVIQVPDVTPRRAKGLARTGRRRWPPWQERLPRLVTNVLVRHGLTLEEASRQSDARCFVFAASDRNPRGNPSGR